MARGKVEIKQILVCESIRQETNGLISLVGAAVDRHVFADNFGRIRASSVFVSADIDCGEAQCSLRWERADGTIILNVSDLISEEDTSKTDFSNNDVIMRAQIVLQGPASISPGEYGDTYFKVKQAEEENWSIIDTIKFVPNPERSSSEASSEE